MVPIEHYEASTLPVLADYVGRVLKASGLIALPTESYYGLAASPFNQGGLEKLWLTKGRTKGKPLLLLIGARSQLSSLVLYVPSAATVLMNAFWPGPLTIIFPAAKALPNAVTAGTKSVGIRLSPCKPLVELLLRIGPVTGTSANREGAPPSCTADKVREALGDALDLIVDMGPTPGGKVSTIIDVQGPIRILREGAIPRSTIEAELVTQGFHLEDAQPTK